MGFRKKQYFHFRRKFLVVMWGSNTWSESIFRSNSWIAHLNKGLLSLYFHFYTIGGPTNGRLPRDDYFARIALSETGTCQLIEIDFIFACAFVANQFFQKTRNPLPKTGGIVRGEHGGIWTSACWRLFSLIHCLIFLWRDVRDYFYLTAHIRACCLWR
jgi:hypothetical protein